MPSDATFKRANSLHRFVRDLTGGRLGWRGAGMPVIELTTTGAKSGLPRTVLLTSPRQGGDEIIVVASRGGTDQNPDWYHNILKAPEVRVAQRGKPAAPMVARVADADERARLWPLITKDHDNYAGY